MSDISTQNLDDGGDNPRSARVEILEAVQRVNSLTQYIKTDVQDLVRVNTSVQVDGIATLNNDLAVVGNSLFIGDAEVNGALSLNGDLLITNAPVAGKVLASAGPGNPITWVDQPPAGDKFKGLSTTSLTIDTASPKNVVVETGLSFTPGQSVVIANDASHYMSGVVLSYDSVTGDLSFTNDTRVGSGTYASWTVNVNGGKGSAGTNGTNGATWYNGAAAPSNGLGVDEDYFVNTENGDYYEKQAGAWVQIGNMHGLTGAAGSKWYNGAGAPSNGVGANGDYYLNQTNGDFYLKTTGAWGLQGNLKGADGAPGSKWYNGIGAPAGGTGVNDDYYVNTANGDYYQKQTGAWTLLGNLTGPAGGAGGGSSTVFSTSARYQAVTTTGLGVTILSSSSVKTGIAWTRSGTSMTFTDNGHGRSVGERAILKNANVTGFDSLITAATTNTFTVTCADSGATSGSAGAYSMGFTFAYNAAAGTITAGTISAPANWDCVLLSIRIHMAANTRTGTTWNLTVPKGNVNGAGPHTSNDDVVIPVQQIRQDVNNLTAVGNSIAYNVGGDWGVYTFGALPAATTGIQIVANF